MAKGEKANKLKCLHCGGELVLVCPHCGAKQSCLQTHRYECGSHIQPDELRRPERSRTCLMRELAAAKKQRNELTNLVFGDGGHEARKRGDKAHDDAMEALRTMKHTLFELTNSSRRRHW